jgi:AraC family transcriptional regulator, transcriptional activator of pobA
VAAEQKISMMELNDFIKDKAGCYSVEPGLAVWEVKNSEFLRKLDVPEVHIQLFIIRGRLNAVLDNSASLIIRSDSLIDILHNKLFINEASDDIHVIFLFTTETFISNFMNNKPPFPIEYIMQVIRQPVLLLNHEQTLIIHERLDLVLRLFRDTTNYLQKEMLKCALWMVYLEMANIFHHQNEDMENPSETDRKRILLMKFVKLLPLHIRQERSIGFYASELCVSGQYLERVVKAVSGQTAYQWIQRGLIGEVNHLLKETDKTMQQIADEFGFPDQATFTKFYKRNVKMTPTEFRGNNIM